MALHRKSLSEFRTRLSQDSASTIPIIHFSEVRRYPSLRAVDPNPGTLFGRLWQNAPEQDRKPDLEAALLTSATLSDGKEFSLKSVAYSLGLFKSSHYRLTTGIFEPARLGELSIVLPAENAPTPTLSVADDEFSSDPAWIAYVADMIAKALASGERGLALTLSYRDTRMIAAGVRLRHPHITTLIQHAETDPIQELLTRFSETDGAILLSPSCWEGVNLPGLVKNLVITRIPCAAGPVDGGEHQKLDGEAWLLAFGNNGHDLWALRHQHAQKTAAGDRTGHPPAERCVLRLVWRQTPPDARRQAEPGFLPAYEVLSGTEDCEHLHPG
jgi:hypothetical protein